MVIRWIICKVVWGRGKLFSTTSFGARLKCVWTAKRVIRKCELILLSLCWI